MIFTDDPIGKGSEDKLSRTILAGRISELITSHQGDESYVIGLEGPWGSGKSSFINLIDEALPKAKDSTVCAHRFNPWNYSGEDELQREFFSQLALRIQEVAPNSDASKQLKTYEGFFSKYDYILAPAYAGVSLVQVSRKKASASEELTSFRKKLDKAMRDLDKTFLVIVDDIDRLDSEETKRLFKLVKLMANFPRTVFLLSYDRVRVEQRLTDTATGFSGAEYLKKIIQVSFTLPHPDPQTLDRLFITELNAVLLDIYGTDVDLAPKDSMRWSMIYHDGLKLLIKNIRDFKRLLSSVHLVLPVVGIHDVNTVDFIGLETIRVFAPALYDALSSSRSILLEEGHSYGSSINERLDKTQTVVADLMKVVDSNHVSAVTSILRQLFPRLDPYASHYDESTLRGERRIASKEKFWFYFKLAVPEGAVSETELRSVIEMANDTQSITTKIIDWDKRGALETVLDRFKDYSNVLTPRAKALIIRTVYEESDKLVRELRGPFGIELDFRVTSLAIKFLESMPADVRQQTVRDWINSTTDIFFREDLLTHLISMASDSNVETLVGEEILEELKQHLIQDFRAMSEAGTLDKQRKMLAILFAWHRWGFPEEVKEFIASRTKTLEELLDFVPHFYNQISSSEGTYDVFFGKWWDTLFGLAELDERISQVDAATLEKLSPPQLRAYELVRDRENRF